MEAKVNGERASSGPVVQQDIGIGRWYSLVRGELMHVIDGVPCGPGYLDWGERDWKQARDGVITGRKSHSGSYDHGKLGHMTQCPLMELGTEPVLALGPMREALHRPRLRDVSPSL